MARSSSGTTCSGRGPGATVSLRWTRPEIYPQISTHLLIRTNATEGKDRDSFLELLYAAGLCNMAKFEEEAVPVRLQGVRACDCMYGDMHPNNKNTTQEYDSAHTTIPNPSNIHTHIYRSISSLAPPPRPAATALCPCSPSPTPPPTSAPAAC